MGRAKRCKPFDPAKQVYDRQVTEKSKALKMAMLIEVEMKDPYGDDVTVMRATRDDPLGKLYARRQIGEAQYRGGLAFQDDFECVERGAQAVDPSKPYVDCSRGPDGISEAYSRALARLNQVQRSLGLIGSKLTHAVLIDRQTIEQFCGYHGIDGQYQLRFYGRRFRECLDELAGFYSSQRLPKFNIG